ncbi:alpha/beta hydrolase [Paenibacillus paeoniae]|uniref:Alpha/beta hydrolase n=1 Tax=Paenibacillus paeoniae TaxID=2292705 RepID=A0A371PLF7_9BACL|nr:alpha/beta hydrolase [Paenibacillus paeoniae]REK76943.1 alpha/beta hydrolase [Paenibacillus paeoniae]
MKKLLFTLLKIVGIILLAIIVLMITMYAVNAISDRSEKSKIQSYGQHVEVDGKNMNVLIEGSGEETVVLLPGYGTAAPALDFKPLVDELSPHYKVVVVEPFGYGLSDITDKERTLENMTTEVHTALQKLGIDRYILMGHSIAGIYGLEYVNQYRDEVTAFVGIDTSVPAQGGGEEIPADGFNLLKSSGVYRLLLKLAPDQVIAPDVDKETWDQIRMLTLRNTMNENIANESKYFDANFKAVESKHFPADLPLIFFLDGNTTDVADWIPMHEEQIKDSIHGKVVTMDGTHYLHHLYSKEIAEQFRAFLSEIEAK